MKPFALIPFCAALALAAPAGAEVRALLVGVSDYQYLDADLRGPQNDVRLMAEALVARGVSEGEIRVLTTAPGLVGDMAAGAPTRGQILAGLDHLAAVSGPGDTVVFHFSGHGAQAPDLNGDEQGGYDEIFLPSDAKNWNGAIGTVENAITDDEFREKARAILATGAELVVVLDACHSATGFRALGARGAARTITPEALGIPDVEVAGNAPPPAPLSGKFAFLYSSQSNERSFEYPLGDKDDPANWYGDFTRAVAQVLETAPRASWQQVLAGAMEIMGRDGAAQTPDGEGPLMAAPVFGEGGVAERFRTEGATLKAGLLSGINAGAVVGIYADATGAELLAEAEVASVEATSATLSPLKGSLPASGMAEQLAPGLPPVLRFSAPIRADAGDGADYSALGAALRAADVERVEIGAESYDYALVLTDGGLAVTGPDGVLTEAAPRYAPDPAAPHGLTTFLEDFAHLARLKTALVALERSGASAFSLPGAGLVATYERRSGRVASDGACLPPRPDTKAETIGAGADLAHCDELWLVLKNNSLKAQDVTVLYADAALQLSALYPGRGLSNRIGFGEEVRLGFRIEATLDRPAAEELIILSLPAEPGAPRTELTALALSGPTRAAAASAVESFVTGALFTDMASRDFFIPGAMPALDVTRAAFTLRPPAPLE